MLSCRDEAAAEFRSGAAVGWQSHFAFRLPWYSYTYSAIPLQRASGTHTRLSFRIVFARCLRANAADRLPPSSHRVGLWRDRQAPAGRSLAASRRVGHRRRRRPTLAGSSDRRERQFISSRVRCTPSVAWPPPVAFPISPSRVSRSTCRRWSACVPAGMNYRSSSAYDLGNQDTSARPAGGRSSSPPRERECRSRCGTSCHPNARSKAGQGPGRPPPCRP